MKLESIISKRTIEKSSSFDLIYEWEDILSQTLDLSMVMDNGMRLNRLIKRLKASDLFTTTDNALIFKMSPWEHTGFNKQNIIPLIVDFHLEKEQMDWFNQAYSRNKLVFISNKEAYDFLKFNNCPLNIHHLALSISDIYRITPNSHFDKKYDLVLMGRQNPVMLKFLEKYIKLHPDFVYVYRNEVDNHYHYYVSTGEYIGDIVNRQDYISLMRQAKIGLYATPGLDGGEIRTHGFNQVTPRFLEYISCGCHIIARYPKNSDTDYYEMYNFSESIESYEQFEAAMDKARFSNVDMIKYSNYLDKHYTSARAKEMSRIVSSL